jgi:anti-sigma B factor antagonist
MFPDEVEPQPWRAERAHTMSDDGVFATVCAATETSDHQVVIAVRGEIDAATVETLVRALNAIDSADCTTVVVDLAEVSFIDSSGLNALLIGRRALARHDIGLVVRNPQPQARRLFDVALGGVSLEDVASA